MSSLSSLKLESKNNSNYNTKSFNLKNKNRYANTDIKILITKYKEKQIVDSVNEKLSDINNQRIKKDTIENLQNEKNSQMTTTTKFKTSPNFFNSKTPKIKNKFYFSHTNINFYNNDNDLFEKKKFIYQENELDRKEKLNDRKYLNKYFSTYKQANSIYFILNKRTKNYLDNINKYIHRVESNKKKIKLGLSPFPNISLNREFRFTDSVNKCITIYDKSFPSRAIGERYERHMNELLKLKQILKNIKIENLNEKNDYFYKMLSNYLQQNGIFDKKFYTEKYLKNLKDFLNIDFDVQSNIPYKEFLYNILKGKYDNYLHNPMDSNNSSLAYFEKNGKKKIIKKNSIESMLSDNKSYTVDASRRSSKFDFQLTGNFEVVDYRDAKEKKKKGF